MTQNSDPTDRAAAEINRLLLNVYSLLQEEGRRMSEEQLNYAETGVAVVVAALTGIRLSRPGQKT